MRPGGYFELQDCIVPAGCIGDSWDGTTMLERWTKPILEATTKIGKDWTRAKHCK
jgi:hypothetical protein